MRMLPRAVVMTKRVREERLSEAARNLALRERDVREIREREQAARNRNEDAKIELEIHERTVRDRLDRGEVTANDLMRSEAFSVLQRERVMSASSEAAGLVAVRQEAERVHEDVRRHVLRAEVDVRVVDMHVTRTMTRWVREQEAAEDEAVLEAWRAR